MNLVETVVAYDVHDLLSERHMMKRNGSHVAVCGLALQPWANYRYLEGFQADRDAPEATCNDCLWTRARWLVESVKGQVSEWAKALVNRASEDEFSMKLEVLLADALVGTGLTAQRLVEEHFPREVVERAEVRAEIREETEETLAALGEIANGGGAD